VKKSKHWQGRCLIDGHQLGFMGLDLFKPENSSKAEYLRECPQSRTRDESCDWPIESALLREFSI
jgi:hypothetical protein